MRGIPRQGQDAAPHRQIRLTMSWGLSWPSMALGTYMGYAPKVVPPVGHHPPNRARPPKAPAPRPQPLPGPGCATAGKLSPPAIQDHDPYVLGAFLAIWVAQHSSYVPPTIPTVGHHTPNRVEPPPYVLGPFLEASLEALGFLGSWVARYSRASRMKCFCAWLRT